MPPRGARVRRSCSSSRPAIASIDFVMPKRWRSRAGWPILRSKVVYRPQPAHRAGVGPEPLRARRATLSGALCLLVAACLAAAGCQQEIPATASPKKTDAAAPRAGPEPERCGSCRPRRRTVARTVAATGTLAADEQVVLGTKVVGRLAEISVDLGSLVKKGQPIAQHRHRATTSTASTRRSPPSSRRGSGSGSRPTAIDDRVDPTQTAVVRQARALLDQAQLTRDRLARLWEQQYRGARASSTRRCRRSRSPRAGTRTRSRRSSNRQAVLLQRRSEVELARQQLTDTAILSPIDGAVSRAAGLGRRVPRRRGAGGDPRARSTRCGSGSRCPSARPPDVRAGQPVRVTVEGDPTVYAGHGGAPVAGDRRAEPHAAHRGGGAQQREPLCGPARSPGPRSWSRRTSAS